MNPIVLSDISDLQHALLPLINSAIEAAIETHCHDAPVRLIDAIRYAWLAPGKRLRPMLVLLAAKAAGGKVEQALPAAVAVEAIHCYSLIHDDLPAMDDDDLRRGRATCHIQFDEATAILAGDALQPLAFAALASGLSDQHKVAMSVSLLANAAGATALVGGQMDDMLAEQNRIADKALLARIHQRKTGAMIRVSAQLGAVAAGANATQMDAITRFGDTIGLAFQIVDDLLDVQSDAESMGKQTGKDATRGKLTYPALYGVAQSREKAMELMEHSLAALECLDEAGEGLSRLARYVINRSN